MSTVRRESSSEARSRAGIRCGIAAVLTAVSYFGARVLLERGVFDPSLRTLVALAPVPFFAFFLFSEMAVVRRLDELQRQMHLEALVFAYPALVVLLLVLGLLEVAGIEISSADWSYRHIWQMALALYVMGFGLARWRYR